MPPVRVDRIMLNDETNDLIVATHGRGIIVLDDVAALEAASTPLARGDVRLLTPRAATPAYEWRDLPWPAADAFVVPNPPVGTFVTYSIGELAAAPPPAARADTSRPRTPPAKIQIIGPDAEVIRELSGPGTSGTHRVVWDLRSAVPFLPAPSDSGYYGAYRGPFVLPGRYTVKLAVAGKEVSQQVEVRSDPRAATTPAALATRHAMSTRIAELSGIYATAAKALAAVDAELGRLAASVKAMPNAPAGSDSSVAATARRIGELKPRFSPSYGTPMGRAFDLL